MPGRTGSEWAYFQRNRLVRKEDLADHLMQYWQAVLEDFIGPIWAYAGLFESVGLAGDGADKFKLSSYASPAGIARQEFLRPGEIAAYIEAVQFQNTSGIDYHIGLRPTYILSELVINPKDGTPQWTLVKHMIGLEDNPDSVVDNLDDTLTMVVDSITESGVSNAGRKVQVFQFLPAKGATSYAIATQICTVAWVGGSNKITTVDAGSGEGYLGQTTPSTTASDYTVVLLGPHVSRNTDLSLDEDYAYLGTVKGTGAGNPPTVFDTSGQIVFGSDTISNLWQITRLETGVSPSRLKIDVKAVAAEEGSAISQIRVSGWDGVGGAKTVFDVDELGNVTIEGDLDVKGETTQEDLVTVNASEIISDSLTLGDHDTSDSHLIKGTWWHRDAAESATWFLVDGSTGTVGIGGAASATDALKVTGTTLFAGHVGVGGAADVTDALKIVGTTQLGGTLKTDGTPRAIGETSARMGKLWNTSIDCSSECQADELWTVRSNGPRVNFDRGDASDTNHQRNFAIGSFANGSLHFRSYSEDWASSTSFMTATKNATGYGVDYVTLSASVLIDLSSDIEVGGDLKAKAGGDRDLGGSGTAEWALFYLKDDAGYGVAGHFVPNADGTLTLGNWAWGATDTGYRWSSLLATELAAIKASEPSVYLRKTGIAADEKTWRFHIDAGDDLVLETMSDVPASGVSVLKVTRGTGTAVTQIDIYHELYMAAGETMHTSNLFPLAGATYSCGADTLEWADVVAKDIRARDNAPRIFLEEKDQSSDRQNWGFWSVSGDLACGAYNLAKGAATAAFYVHRDTGDVYTVSDIEFWVPIQAAATHPFIVAGSTGNTFNLDMFSYESGLGSDEGRWRWTTTDDGNGHLKLVTVTDAGGAGADILRVIRGSGTGIGTIECYTDFVPATDSAKDLGAISPGNLRWLHGYINRPVIEKRTITNTGDAGTEGMITFDDDYIYCCIGTNSWARVGIATW